MAGSVFQIEFQGQNYFVPEPTRKDHIQSHMKAKRKFYEESFLGYLREICPEEGIVLDCGANVGNHSLFFSGVMQKKVVAFEPVKANRDILEATISLNELSGKVTIAPFALGEEEGLVVLEQAIEGNFGSFQATSVTEQTRDAVHMTTVDKYLSGIDLDDTRVAMMKVDVEGFEQYVLRGAKKTLSKYRPIVALEVSTVGDYERLRAILTPLGYVPVSIFNHTPTVVFASGVGHRDRSWRISRKIAGFEKRASQ